MGTRPSQPPAALRGRWLLLARVAWVVLTVLVIGLHVAGIPYFYAHQIESLNPGQLTPEQVRGFENLGLTPHFYAAYTVALPVGTMLVFSAIATVIFWRKSDDRMALFAAFTLAVFGGAALTSDVPQALAAAHPSLLFPVHLLDYLGQVAFGVLFYIFPNGRFVPRWTRWLALVWAALWVPVIFFQGSSLNILGGPLFIGFLACFLGFLGSLVVAQVYRYRRVSSPAERQQTKWVVFGVAVALVGSAALITLVNLVLSPRSLGPLAWMAVSTCVYGLIALIPLSIGVAVLRSGLYEIDVIINRTLVYGPLTATLIALYFGGIVVLQRLFVLLTGQQSTVAVVASTLLIAALFSPLRRRVKGFVDRRFYRRKYDAQKILEAFSAKLRDETDLEALNNELLGVVRSTLQPAHVSLWLRPDKVAKGKQPH